ncbi:MAG TPA: periplasmic heavy metal sensor [Thermoanaerobaculia bacterium]|nr:periplasmic heavy metal sensor [Thermoanaerobaculia bacterium]
MTRAARWAAPLALLLATLALPLAAQTTAAARPDPGELFRNPRALARFLRLNEQQLGTFRQLYGQLQQTLKPLREQQRVLYEDLHDALEQANPDPCAVGQIQIDLHEGREQIRAAFETFDTAFSAILTPAQLAKWNALKGALRFLEDAAG